MEQTTEETKPGGAVIDGPVIVIETTANIPMDLLKRKFKENIEFVIDVDNSRLKGDMLLTYLSNLKLNCKLKFGSLESSLELLSSYLKMSTVMSIPELEDLAMNIMLAAYGKDHYCQFDPTEFIRDNSDMIDVWLRRMCALPLFALHCHPTTKDFVSQFPVDEDHELHGINYVQLIKHELFPEFINDFNQEDMSYNRLLFNEYCFAGLNLFNYFAIPNNPLFVGLMVLDKPEHLEVLMAAAHTTYVTAETIMKELEHVPSV
jgi:hypothetical protein